jgi:hypothetical protein
MVGGNSLTDAAQISCTNSLNVVIESRNIMPGETVQGWLFVQIPSEGLPAKWRVRITDSTKKHLLRNLQGQIEIVTFPRFPYSFVSFIV